MSNLFNSTIGIKEIASIINIECPPDFNMEISSISDSNATLENSVCDYIKGPLPSPKNNLILFTKKSIEGYNCIITDSPQEDILMVINHIESTIGFKKKYENTKIPSSVTIGHNVVIEKNVEIGKGTIIEHNVVIHSGTKIGENCLIRTHSSIGGDGFGFFRNKNNQLLKQPHLGGVVLGNNVEIGSNSCIVRGIINDTIICDNVKIDNLVHVAHDCYVGNDTFLTACAELSGYVTIGKNTSIAPNTTIKQRIKIGDNVISGMGAVIFKNVEDNSIVVGNPAKPLRKFGKKP